MPKYRGYSLTPGSPAERRFSTTRYLFHYSQPCVLSRDKFNSCFSFVPAVTPELSALLRFCGSSPAPGASHTPWGPAAHGEIQPCRGHHPAGPSRSQQVPAAPSSSQQVPLRRREKPCRRRPLCTAGKSCTRKPELTRVITDANE